MEQLMNRYRIEIVLSGGDIRRVIKVPRSIEDGGRVDGAVVVCVGVEPDVAKNCAVLEIVVGDSTAERARALQAPDYGAASARHDSVGSAFRFSNCLHPLAG